MALLSSFFSCFSESSESKQQYICDGDVCVIRNQKELRGKTSKNKPKEKKLSDSIYSSFNKKLSKF
jgi:hypothetical protein